MSQWSRDWQSMSATRRTSSSSHHYDIVRNYDERRARSEEPQGLTLRPNREYAKNDEQHWENWDEEDSRPRGRSQSSRWQSEEARVPPQIGRGSGVGKAAPRKPAGPPAPWPCRNSITPQGPHSRNTSDSSWVNLPDEGSRKSPLRDAEGSQPGGSSLKKTRADDRKQAQSKNKRKAASQSEQAGREWRGQREADGRTSPQVEREEKRQWWLNHNWSKEEWKEESDKWNTQEWYEWRDLWDDNQHQMEKLALEKTETHVIIRKDCSEETTAPYYQSHALVPLEEARAEYDPPPTPRTRRSSIGQCL